jgi:hypothetical protein
MPDQYTLAALDRLERGSKNRPPVMAEVALISSHAPWTPLPLAVEWNEIGDGSIYARAREGDAAEQVWKDPERVREQYRKAIAYSLEILISYVIQRGDENLVLLIVGDHQPAPLVTGDSPHREVLAHLISRDPAIIEAVRDWNWSRGLIPSGSGSGPVWGMDQLRDHIIAAFSVAGPLGGPANSPGSEPPPSARRDE